eukprot:210112-Pleurochrysis_carterae.AAC.1
MGGGTWDLQQTSMLRCHVSGVATARATRIWRHLPRCAASTRSQLHLVVEVRALIVQAKNLPCSEQGIPTAEATTTCVTTTCATASS